jgi:hypothetical protein
LKGGVVPRADWDDLPDAVRDAVLARTGPVSEVLPVIGGLTCPVTVGLTTQPGRWFVKGAPEADYPAWESLYRERLVYPLLERVSPGFGWKVEAAGWELMGYRWVDGHHAELGPGSPDLPLVAEVMLQAQEITTPH